MHRHIWTDFSEQISFIPADYPEGEIRIVIDAPTDYNVHEVSFDQDQFEDFVAQIKEKMGW